MVTVIVPGWWKEAPAWPPGWSGPRGRHESLQSSRHWREGWKVTTTKSWEAPGEVGAAWDGGHCLLARVDQVRVHLVARWAGEVARSGEVVR